MSGHEHEFEAARGLPAPLPAGERLLWSGSPALTSTALHVFHVRKVAAYFAVLVAWRGVAANADGATLAEAARAMIVVVPFALFALALLALLAWLNSRLTVYTITDRRVVMRLGIVLTVTFNLPFARILAAGVRTYRDGSGDLPLTLHAGDHIAWLHLWPHARPWHLRHPAPMLRCIPDAARVARLLGEALATHAGRGALAPAPSEPRPHAPAHSLPAAA